MFFYYDNITSVTNSKDQSVDQDNEFILSTGSNLTLNESRIINFLLSCVRIDDRTFRTIEISYDAMCRILNYNPKSGGRIEYIAKIVECLKDKQIFCRDRASANNEIVTVPWFDICECKDNHSVEGKRTDAGKIVYTFRFNSELELYLLDLKSKFTKCNYSTVQGFTNKYTAKLYMILSSVTYSDCISFSFEDICFLLGFSDLDNIEKKPKFANFKRDVLENALEEINMNTGFTVEYSLDRTARTIKSVIFNVFEKGQGAKIAPFSPLPDVAFCERKTEDGFIEKYCKVEVEGSFRNRKPRSQDAEVVAFQNLVNLR